MHNKTNDTHDFVKIRLNNAERLSLAGLLLRPESGANAALIVCHGFTGSKEGGGRTLEMGRFLSRQTGVAVFVFDFAGNGESQGRFEELTLSGQIKDLTAAVDWCTAALGVPVLTMGRSFGGSTVLCQAAGDTRVRAVCTWAAPARPHELFAGMASDTGEGRIAFSSPEASVRLKKGFLEDLQQHDVLWAAGRLAPRPLMVVHGAVDHDVPPREAEWIYAAAGHPKTIRIIPGADHRFQVHADLAWEATREWIEETLEGLGKGAEA